MAYAPAQLGSFGLGNVVQIAATFDQLGTPTDPASVSVELTDPDGIKSSYVYPSTGSWSHSAGTGIYTLAVTPSVPGLWTGRVFATGSGAASLDFTFFIAASQNYP